jgi:hypothetical protein
MQKVQNGARPILPSNSPSSEPGYILATSNIKKNGTEVSKHLWVRSKKKAEITLKCSTITIDDTKTYLKAAYTVAYKSALKTHESSRLTHIETFPPKQRARILRVEEARQKGAIARTITGKLQGQGVTNIQHCDDILGQEVLTDCVTSVQINNTLLQVNSSKYQQCNNSPFLQEPLLSDLGYFGDTPISANILDDPYAALLLTHMKRPPSLSPNTSIPDTVTTEERAGNWKRAKEYTSAGISGIHFGMYKAQAADQDLAQYDATSRSIMYNTGESYPRWHTGVDVMLLKASGDTRAHKLCTILLLEADFNMNNKLLSRQGMWMAEQHEGCLVSKQCGGRRHHRANETSLNSTLMCDDSRF